MKHIFGIKVPGIKTKIRKANKVTSCIYIGVRVYFLLAWMLIDVSIL